MRLRRGLPLLLAALALGLYAVTLPGLYSRPRPQAAPEMEVALPVFVQVLMAGGDRYLAANLAGFRALVASTEKMQAENYRVLAKVQSDLAWLNPAHEDNYYTATAILPWVGEVAAAQRILAAASIARPFDWQPPFYYAFNAWHFGRDPQTGANWLRIAASHSHDVLEQLQFEQLAAQWVSKGEDREQAIRFVRAMAKETRHQAFARFLEKRVQRLENQLALERACQNFRARNGRLPSTLEELPADDLTVLPQDPFAQSYRLDTACRAEIGNAAAVRAP